MSLDTGKSSSKTGRETLFFTLMSETSQNVALAKLLGSISDRRIGRKVKKLMGFGAEAVRSFGELDSALYSRENGEDQLQIISDAVMSHVRHLLNYLRSITAVELSDESEDLDLDLAFEFNTGEFDIGEVQTLSKTNNILEGDRAGLLPSSRTRPPPPPPRKRPPPPPNCRTDEDKWGGLVKELGTLQYGLESEILNYDQRFSKALEQDRKDQALRDLSDAVTSLLDGVFAVMTAVYQEFLGYADPDRMIFGHRETLAKALQLRRSITELRQEVQELNRLIQDSQSSSLMLEMSYKLLTQSLAQFIEDDVYSYLRASDRGEFTNFAKRLLDGTVLENRLDCEGLDKYLDSLAVVSQRDVLMKHDSDLRTEISDELEEAMRLTSTQPIRVLEIIGQSFVKADRLFGLMDDLDSLVFKWSNFSEEKKNNLSEVLDLGCTLKLLVAVPKLRAPSDEKCSFL